MKKNLFLTIVFIAVFTFTLSAQFNWAHNFGGADNDGGNHIATDAAGNTYVTGYLAAPHFSILQ